MADKAHAIEADERRPVAVQGGSPRVTVAFPFSTIKIHEPEPGLAELAAIVAQLAEDLAGMPAGKHATTRRRLAQAARQLADRLGAARPAAPDAAASDAALARRSNGDGV